MVVLRRPGTLEHAIFRAAQAVGGMREASQMLGRHDASVAHAANPEKPDMLRLDDAMRLDAMARESGGGSPILEHYTRSLREAVGPGLPPGVHLGAVSREAGELVAVLAESLVDGSLTETERGEVREAARELRLAAETLLTDLDDVERGTR